MMRCCRTCSSAKNLHPIFQVKEKCEKYTFLLKLVTGLTIKINDNLPQYMCTNCVKIVNQSIKFRERCHSTNLKLTETLPCSKLNSGISNNNIMKIVKEVTVISDSDNDGIQRYNEDRENNDYSVRNNNDHRFKEKTDNIESMLQRRTNIVLNNLPQTEKVKLKYDLENEIDKKDSIQAIGPMECKFCNKIFKTKMSLNNHIRVHSSRNVICEHCGKKFRSKRHLLIHCRSKHEYEKLDKCSFCCYKGSSAEMVKIHERMHTGERPYVCVTCGASFYRRSTYLQHVPIHLPMKTVPCPECPALFKSITLMRIHRTRHKKRRFKQT